MDGLNPIAQWEIILLLISSEEKLTNQHSITESVSHLFYNDGVVKILKEWLLQMHSMPKEFLFNSEPFSRIKSEELSCELRKRGNISFKSGHVDESYNAYTKSILLAPWNGTNFSLALANRSAALFHMERYEECISDINLSLGNGYPLKLMHKLFIRKAESLFYLSDFDNAEDALNSASKYLEKDSQLATDQQNEIFKTINILGKRLNSSRLSHKEPKPKKNILPNFSGKENDTFVSTNSSITLKYSNTHGRHVIAKDDIQRGDILFVEKPYAFIALPHEDGFVSIVCENCCQSDINPIPCNICSLSVYCCDECRLEAWNNFHQWECNGFQCKIWHTIGIAHLALRVLLISTNAGFPIQNTNVMTAEEILQCFDTKDHIECYGQSEDKFYRMFHLVTNFQKMDPTDYKQYAITAVMLTLYLENYSDYFEHLKHKIHNVMDIVQLRLLVAALLLRHLGQLVCNGHAISGIENISAKSDLSYEKDIRLATAIYPSASMMNHSCNPNIINSFHKSYLIVKAMRNIPKGTEVFNCYGPNYMRNAMTERQTMLKAQYLFDCACDACTDPEKADFSQTFCAYSCHKCKGPVLVIERKAVCKQCKVTDHKLENMQSLVSKADELSKQASLSKSFQERYEKLTYALKLRQQCLHRHHVAIRENIDQLACLYAEQGDYSKSIDMIKQCIPTLEHQFGSFSIEVANELQKLSDVMFARVMNSTEEMRSQGGDFRAWCMESQKITRKAVQLFDLNYGHWHSSIENLKTKEKIIEDIMSENQQLNNESQQSIHNLVHYNLKI